MNLESAIQYELGCSRHVFQNTGGCLLRATILPVSPSEYKTVLFCPRDCIDSPEGRDQFAQMVAAYCRHSPSWAVIFSSEAWTLHSPDPDKPLPSSLSDHPDRQECIFLNAILRDRTIVITQHIARENGKILFGKEHRMDTAVEGTATNDRFSIVRPYLQDPPPDVQEQQPG